jgi:hypothetical protein
MKNLFDKCKNCAILVIYHRSNAGAVSGRTPGGAERFSACMKKKPTIIFIIKEILP